MTQVGTLTHLQSKSMDPCYLTKDADARAMEDWLCRGCAAPRPGLRAIDARIQEDDPGPIPLSFVGGAGLTLARLDFLIKVVGSDGLEKDFLLGRVFRENGSVIEGWATVQGRRKIIVRGTEHVSHRVCEICGRHVYFAMGNRHVAPPPPDDAWAYETDLGLAVPTDAAKLGKIRGVTVESLPILDRGLDGITELDVL